MDDVFDKILFYSDDDKEEKSPEKKKEWKNNKDSGKKDWKNNNGYSKMEYNITQSITKISELYVERKKNDAESLEKFQEKLFDARFVKDLHDIILKNVDDDDDEEESSDENGKFDNAPFAAFIYEFTIKNREKLGGDHRTMLFSIVGRMIKKRAKQVLKRFKKKDKPSKNLIKEVCLVLPSDDIINPNSNIFNLVQQVNTKIYLVSADDDESLNLDSVKSFKRFYSELFGEDNLSKCAVGCLLERKRTADSFSNDEQKKIWSKLSSFALSVLDELEKDEIEYHVALYTKRRFADELNRINSPRRINFLELDDDKYKNIYKVIKRLSKEQKFARCLN
jgi:hypothetical protein